MPVLLPLFAVPLIALDSTLWIARARAEEQLRDPLTGLPNRQWLLERTWTALDDAERMRRPVRSRADRPRPLPLGQRHPRPPGRRPAAAPDRRAAAAGPAARRRGGPARRRRVRRPAARRRLHHQRPARRPPPGRRAVSSPLDLDGLTLVLEASAGVAVFPDHALDAEGLLRRADVAMYQAKRDRTGVEVYESKRDSNTPDRLGLLGDLRRALDAGEVELHYQPKVRFDGQVAGPRGPGALGAPGARAGARRTSSSRSPSPPG